MGRIRRLIRGGLRRASSVVSKHELFEKPGERTRTESLPPRTPSERPPAPAQAPAPPRPVEVPEAHTAESGQVMLSVPVLDLDGVLAFLGAGRGLRVVNHWATWCIPCVEEFDLLKSLNAQLPDGVPLEGLSWDLFDPRGDEDDIAEHVANFSSGHSLPYPSSLIGEEVEPPAFFEALGLSNQTIPQTWLVDDNGAVVYRVEGALTEAHFEPLLSAIYDAGGDFGGEDDG